jgi:hypothetical protein
MNKCSYCQKEFKTQHTLLSHVKRSKKCILSRGEIVESKYNCEFCDYIGMIKNDLIKHKEICKTQKIVRTFQNKILELENYIKELKQKNEISPNIKNLERDNIILENQILQLHQQLKDKDNTIKELAQSAIQKYTNTTNTTNTTNIKTNYNITLAPITEDFINEQVQYLTIDHIKKGALGYSNYFLDYPLKDRILCTDFSRRKFKYKNEQGNIVIDPEMTNLSNLLFKSIKEKNRELSIQYINDINKKIGNTDTLEYWMNIASKFSEQDLEVLKMFNGEKNDFFHDIIRNISCKTLEKI